MKENYPDFVWANVEKEVDFDPEAQSYIVQPHARDQVNIKGRNAVSTIVIIISILDLSATYIMYCPRDRVL